MSRRRRKSAPFSLFAFQDIITSVTGIMLVITMLLALELLERTDASPPRATAAISKDLKQSIEAADREIDELEQRLKKKEERLAGAASVSPTQLRRQIGDLEDANRRLRNRISQSRQRDQQTQDRVAKVQQQQQQETSRQRQQRLADLLQQASRKRQQLKKLRKSNRVIFNPAPGNPKTPWLVEISDRRLIVAESGVVARPRLFADVATFLDWARQQDSQSAYFVLLLKPDGIEPFREAKAGLDKAGFDIGFDLLSVGQTVIDPETGGGIQR